MTLRRKRKTKRRKRNLRSLTDEVRMYKEDAIETMDDIVLDSLDKTDYEDFKEYEEDMQDFTFSNIFQ